jgi:predicted nucleotidyltransferase
MMIEQIRKDLYELSNYWVVLFGSALGPFYTKRSDLDIAVITQSNNIDQNYDFWTHECLHFPPKYDIKLFELLSLTLQNEIINSYEVIFGDPVKISEYFYMYRKMYADMLPRIRENSISSLKEKQKRLNRYISN